MSTLTLFVLPATVILLIVLFIRQLDWSKGSVAVLSLAAVYYLWVRPLLFTAIHPGETPDALTWIWPCVILGIFAVFLRKNERRSDQAKVDVRARRRLESVKDGRIKQFMLYLRPFKITNELPVADPASHSTRTMVMAGFVGGEELTTSDFEDVLGRAVERLAPFLALGRPGEAFGATRIQISDDLWEEEAKWLMEKAHVIFLVPSLTSGTLWEIMHIVTSRYLQKTVFILPPGFLATAWVDICDRLAKEDCGLRLFCPNSAIHASRGIWRYLSIGLDGWFFMLNETGATVEAIAIVAGPNGVIDALTKLASCPHWPVWTEPEMEPAGGTSEVSLAPPKPLVIVRCPNCGVNVVPTGNYYPCCRRALEYGGAATCEASDRPV